MDSHLRLPTAQDIYQCSVWPESFALKEKLGSHLRANQNYMSCCRCEVCGKLFSSVKDLKTHLWTHTKNEKPHACQVCEKSFSQIGSLNNHRRKVHGEGTVNNSSQQLQLPHQQPHQDHQEHRHQQHLQIESSVDQSSHTHSHTQGHTHNHTHDHTHGHSHGHTHTHSIVHSLDSHDPQVLDNSDRKISPPCEICGKTFAFQNYVKLHQSVHTKEKAFCCDLCPKKFSQPSSRNRHRKKSHKIEGGSSTSCLPQIQHHLGQGGMQSPSCVTSGPEHHPKKNSPPCEVCGKTFAFKNYMKAHSRVHSKEKPYSCPVCYRRFTQASSRNFHRKRMHKEAGLSEPPPPPPPPPQQVTLQQQPQHQQPPQPLPQTINEVSDEKPFHCKACLPSYPFKQ